MNKINKNVYWSHEDWERERHTESWNVQREIRIKKRNKTAQKKRINKEWNIEIHVAVGSFVGDITFHCHIRPEYTKSAKSPHKDMINSSIFNSSPEITYYIQLNRLEMYYISSRRNL